jgi:2-keto-myo-inositol isomerase
MATSFALNHMTAPRLSWRDLIALASGTGCAGVEFRNDLPGPLFGGEAPDAVRDACSAAGLRIFALAEVKMFNDWSALKEAEATALMDIAVAAGAEAVSLIPRNDNVATDRPSSLRVTTEALRGLLPHLTRRGLKAMVEPLGFEVCSLRYKDVLAEAIAAVGGQGTYFMVHDTFHHALAGFGPIYPELTGIVHVSGVTEALYLADMRDPHRVLVGADDLLGNVAQIRALRVGGYNGPISFEPFAPSVHALDDPGPALRASMEFLRRGIEP